MRRVAPRVLSARAQRATRVLTVMLAAGLASAVGCSKPPKPKPAEPVAVTPAPTTPAAPKPAAAVAVAPAPTTPKPDDPCRIFDKLPGDPPLWLAPRGVVLTRLMKPCVTLEGTHGYDRATPFLAMGFPCTGGSGRVDIKGLYHNPKMISFVVGTDCAMAPASKDAAQTAITGDIGLAPESKLLAYTPFVVQYWELPGLRDSDVGFSIDLRSSEAVDGTWRRMRDKHETLPVRLYGRENAWVQGGAFFEVEGELRLTDRTAFQLTVGRVKALTPDEIAAIKAKCEALRPARHCDQVF